ncbi:MAG: aminopeptidase [Deferrisomatales bacterium]
MYPMDISRTVRLIVSTCLGVKAGTRILIVGYTDEDLRLATAQAAEAHASGAEAGVVLVAPPRAVEPPEFLAEAMKKVDTVVTLGPVDYGHTHARKELSALGVNFAYIPDLMNQELVDLDIGPDDLLGVSERTVRVAEAVTRARTARVVSAAGTDLCMEVEGRPGLALHPVFRKPGHFAIVPFYYEVACAPVEGTARGTVVTDGTVVGLPGLNGVLAEPIRWTVEGGRVTAIEGGREARRLRELLPAFGENANCIAELGIGMNDRMRNVLVGNRRDNAIFGHIHIALGRNQDLGGDVWSPLHADFLTMDVRLELDGETIIDQGRLAGPMAAG